MKPWLRCGFLLLFTLSTLAQPTITVFVGLEGDPVAELTARDTGGGAARAGLVRAVAARRAEIARQHANVRDGLAQLGAEVMDEHDTLLNALVVQIPEDKLEALKAVPEVRRVQRVRQFQRYLETSTPFVGVPAAWKSAPAGLAGSGVKIGIIDSGIDYHHAMFGGSGRVSDYDNNNPTIIEAGTFPTAKVAGGTDFVGDDFTGFNSPVPDPDPLDPPLGGHGSHVAGITAGLGVLKNGSTFRGSYTQLTDFSQFEIGPGIAPQATLYALKVFGEFGSTTDPIIVKALEWALDPNKDGNFSDRLDVVNLSLGSAFGRDDSEDLDVEAVNRVSRNGVVCVIAAGNSGDTYFISGSPGIASHAITVANSFDNGVSFQSLRVTAPQEIVDDYDFVEGDFTRSLDDTGPVSGDVVYVDPPDACNDVINNADALNGKIALIDRGTCFFVDKIRRAQDAGAIAVIMVNNTSAEPIVMGGEPDGINIPGIMVTRATGNIIKSQLTNRVSVIINGSVTVTRPELADHIAESSSRGPGGPNGRLKPDIAAPGTSIKSTGVGTGTEGKVLTGTSMASPHVAGAAALVRQAHPTWKPEDVKAVLMNTAVSMKDGQQNYYAESRVGAGRLDVRRAATTQFTARADGTNGGVSLSYGVQTIRQPTRLTNRIRIDNLGALGTTFQVSVTNSVPQSGVKLQVLTNNISVGLGASVFVTVVLDIDPTRIDHRLDATSEPTISEQTRFSPPEASGQVWFTSSSTSLHVPWHVIVRSAANYDMLALVVGLPATNRFLLPMPTRGPSGHRQPVVSGFLLGGSKGGITAFGAATDFPTKKNVETASVWFGIALSQPWDTPQRSFKSIDVEIDPSGGTAPASYTIINSTIGNVRAQDDTDESVMNDALVTAVRNEAATTDPLKVVGPLGGLEPEVRDTAIFNNSVLVHAVKATDIGLTAGKTKIRYRVINVTTDRNGNSTTDTGDWVKFDLAKPVLDPTPYGINGTPFFDEGRDVRFNFDRSEATAAGLTGTTTANSPRVLLLHHNNLNNAQVDNLRLDMTKADADNDTLPDLWELANLGELTTLATADPDGDGLTNAQELAGGTNPNDIAITVQREAAGSLAGLPTLHWKGVTGRFYTVERAASLNGPFVPFQRRVTATPPLNVFALPDADGGQSYFYRVTPD